MTAVAGPDSSNLVLTMAHSDRMAGSIPVWAAANSPKTIADQKAGSKTIAASDSVQPYGFHDLLNMVNPLQHIPVVSGFYRELTGETIKPASQVIGDTLFGGLLGGLTSFVNMLAEHATGKTVAGDVVALAEGKPVTLQPVAPGTTAIAGREQVNDSGQSGAGDQAAVLRYADLGNGQRRVYEKISAAGDRMAGSMVRIRTEDIAAAPVPNIVVPVGQAGAQAAPQPRAPNTAVPSRT